MEVGLEISVMKEKMDTWGEVLLSIWIRRCIPCAENMRRYWTLEEMKSLPP